MLSNRSFNCNKKCITEELLLDFSSHLTVGMCSHLKLYFTIAVQVFGASVCGDGATIDRTPLYNIIAAYPNNPMAILDIPDLIEASARCKAKDGASLANLFRPFMEKLESEVNSMGRNHKGIIDLIAFDGAGNLQCAGCILWYISLVSL